jgi:hypothetical protein
MTTVIASALHNKNVIWNDRDRNRLVVLMAAWNNNTISKLPFVRLYSQVNKMARGIS